MPLRAACRYCSSAVGMCRRPSAGPQPPRRTRDTRRTQAGQVAPPSRPNSIRAGKDHGAGPAPKFPRRIRGTGKFVRGSRLSWRSSLALRPALQLLHRFAAADQVQRSEPALRHHHQVTASATNIRGANVDRQRQFPFAEVPLRRSRFWSVIHESALLPTTTAMQSGPAGHRRRHGLFIAQTFAHRQHPRNGLTFPPSKKTISLLE